MENEIPLWKCSRRPRFQAVSAGQLQAGAIARGQQLTVFPGDLPVNNRAHRVQNIAAGKIIGFRNFCPACGLFRALFAHDAGAFQTKLYAGGGMNGIVNTPVAGNEAAQHLAVCRVDDGVRRRVVISPCQRAIPGSAGVKSLGFVTPFFADSSCRYASCAFKKSSLTGAGMRTFIRLRSSRRFSAGFSGTMIFL